MGFIKGILKCFFSAILGFIFIMISISTILLSTALLILYNEDSTKVWLNQTELYEETYRIGTDFIRKNTDSEREWEILFLIDDRGTEVHQAYSQLNEQVKETTRRNQVDLFIDSFYLWVRGETATLSFKLPYFEDPDQMHQVALSFLEKQVAELPICEGYEGIPLNYNPLNSTCRPKDYEKEHIAEFFESIKDTPKYFEITDLTTLDSSRVLEISLRDTSNAQLYYKLFIASPFILILLSILAGALYWWTFPVDGKGGVATGALTALSGLMLFAITYSAEALNLVYNLINTHLHALDRSLFEKILLASSSTLSIVSTVVITVGAVIFLGSALIEFKRNRKGNKISPY